MEEILKPIGPVPEVVIIEKTKLIQTALIVIGFVAFGTIGYFVGMDKKANDELIAEITPTSIPTIIPTAMALPTEIPTITIAPTLKPTIRPTATLTPTPKVNINNSFTCGTFGTNTYPPLAAAGSTPLFVSLYGSGGTANGISMAGFQWDYDGDGTWDSGTINGQANRVYTTKGVFIPKYRVVGTNGEYGPTCVYPNAVEAGGTVEYQNEFISINKLYTDVTVSRSKPNFQFYGNDENLNNGGSRIYIPFLTVSSKEKFTAVRIKATYNWTVGFYETGRDMNGGTGFHENLFIDKSKPNGTYEGEFMITYTTDNGTVTKDAGVARYKITLTD